MTYTIQPTSVIGQLGGLLLGIVILGSLACRPSDVLEVPPPSGEFAYSGLQGRAAAEAELAFGEGELFTWLGEGETDYPFNNGLAGLGGLLGDEFMMSAITNVTATIYLAGTDARVTSSDYYGNNEQGDGDFEGMLQARQSLLLAEGVLQQYESGNGKANVGYAYALAGYVELFLAEDYCAGVPLDNVVAGGGWSYGEPLTTDSLLQVAASHFDSALSYTAGNDTVTALASIGRGRAELDLGNYATADSTVTNAAVPVNFVYNSQLEPSTAQNIGSPNVYYGMENDGCGWFNVSNLEGGNGLDFVSAHDPRLVLDSMIAITCDGSQGPAYAYDSTWYYPLKFGNPSTGLIPLATGIEAQLIIAEAQLAAGETGAWLTTLNTLRNSGCSGVANSDCTVGTGQVVAQQSGLQSLADPGTASSRTDLMFRERAFWLFGTGTRLGDMRRLIRQYGRSVSEVYPSGTYNEGLFPTFLTYGSDVDFTLPTSQSNYTTTNPYYKGCTTPTTQA